MYEAFFGLDRRPFPATPDPHCCFLSGSAGEAFAELVQCITMGEGIGILTAPAGTGKTLLCRRLALELGGQLRVALLATANFPTYRAFLQAVLYELDQPYSGMDEQELRLELLSVLRSLPQPFEGLLLILDEAHLLPDHLLEEIRILADLAAEGRPLVRVILAGQPQLEEQLTAPHLTAFNQRVTAQVQLDPLTRQETAEYIAYRLQLAGSAVERMFTPEALELIVRACDGLPRCVNQLCDHSLLLSFVADKAPVEAETVREALGDLQQLPLHWNTSVLTDRIPETTLAHAEEPEAEPADLALWGPLKGGASIEIGAEEFPAVAEGSMEDEDPVDSLGEPPIDEAEPAAPVEPVIEPPIVQRFAARKVKTSHDGPQEERVVDRYAALDAGRIAGGTPVPLPRVLAPTPPPAPPVVSPPVVAAAPIPEPLEPIHEMTPRPDHLIDKILPLIDDVLGDLLISGTPHESEPVAAAVVEDRAENPSSSPLVEASLEAVVELHAEPEGASTIEDQIGEEVLELCLQTQAMLEERGDYVPLAEELSSAHEVEPPRATRFDVIQPEAAASQSSPPEPSAASLPMETAGNPPRKPNYKQIFSTLRKRHRRGA